jgi:hypothetical protein
MKLTKIIERRESGFALFLKGDKVPPLEEGQALILVDLIPTKDREEIIIVDKSGKTPDKRTGRCTAARVGTQFKAGDCVNKPSVKGRLSLTVPFEDTEDVEDVEDVEDAADRI